MPRACRTRIGWRSEDRANRGAGCSDQATLSHPQGDAPLQPSARVSMSEKNGMQVLEIQEVSQDDVGVYTCLVVNGSGKASMSAELSIQGRARRLGHTVPPAICTLLACPLCVSVTHVLFACPGVPRGRVLNPRKEVSGRAAQTWPPSTPHQCHHLFLVRLLFYVSKCPSEEQTWLMPSSQM